MNKFAVLILSTALAVSASAQSKVPSRMVSVVQQPVMAPASTNLSTTLLWQNDNWPTNIDITAQYWEAADGKSYVSTQGFVTINSASNSFMKGSNIVGATYNTNGNWTIDSSAVVAVQAQITASPGVADYIHLTTTGDWFKVDSTENSGIGSRSNVFTGFIIESQYTNLLNYSGGILMIPTGYVALIHGYGSIKVKETNQVSAALQFFNRNEAGVIAPEATVIEYDFDIDDITDPKTGDYNGWKYGTRSAAETYFKATPNDNEKRIQMGATFTYGHEVVNGTKTMARWRRVHVMLFKIPVQ